MREWVVRMVIRTNEGDGRAGREEYYTDDEMPGLLRALMDGALEDIDDGPQIIWSEFIRTEDRALPTLENHDHVWVKALPPGLNRCVFDGCTAVWFPEGGTP